MDALELSGSACRVWGSRFLPVREEEERMSDLERGQNVLYAICDCFVTNPVSALLLT